MLQDPIIHASILRMNQKVNELEKFTKEWDAPKVAQVAQQRLEELQLLEKRFQELQQKQQAVNDLVILKTKEHADTFFQDKERWEKEMEKTTNELKDLLRTVTSGLDKCVVDLNSVENKYTEILHQTALKVSEYAYSFSLEKLEYKKVVDDLNGVFTVHVEELHRQLYLVERQTSAFNGVKEMLFGLAKWFFVTWVLSAGTLLWQIFHLIRK